MKTIVLGAGASRAESTAMPLVGDFFRKMFARFPLDDPASANFFESVAADFGVTPGHVRDDRVSIEELLTLLDCDASWHSGETDQDSHATSFQQTLASLAARSTLSYFMAGLLFDAQRSVFETGAVLHRQIGEQLETGDAVISYNYDLVAEFGLASAGKFSPASYHVPFCGEIEGAGFGYADIEPFSTAAKARVDLLKLHGSLNWLHRKHQRTAAATAELPVGAVAYLKDGFQVFVPDGSSGKVFSLLETSGKRGHEFVELVPVIVAPTFDKAIVWGGFAGVLRSLWKRAHNALRASSHLAIIGYSLRDADFQSVWLFRTALRENAANREIWIVNPCKDDRHRLERVFGDYGHVELVETVEEYVVRAAG